MTASVADGNSNTPLSQFNDGNGIPTGSKTKYNPDNNKNVRGDKREARVGLSHELLGHGWDSDQGKADYSKTENGILMYEVNVVNIENRARASAGNEKKPLMEGNLFLKIYYMILIKRNNYEIFDSFVIIDTIMRNGKSRIH
jgi:hypothetical protein